MNNIFLNIVLIKWLGLLGSAISTSVSFTILYITFLFYLRKNFLKGYGGTIALILMLITVGLGLALDNNFTFGLIQQVIMTACSSVFLFLVGVYVSYRFQVSLRKVAMD
jgi:O-antigen/teichoic acid export membrane protein